MPNDDDRSALEPEEVEVEINGPRTPYNLVSGILALLQEARDLAGETYLDRVEQALKQQQD